MADTQIQIVEYLVDGVVQMKRWGNTDEWMLKFNVPITHLGPALSVHVKVADFDTARVRAQQIAQRIGEVDRLYEAAKAAGAAFVEELRPES